MAFWNRDEDTEWEQYQRSARKRGKPEDSQPSYPEETPGLLEKLQGKALSELHQMKETLLPTPEKTPEETPELCPWCGGEMEKGYLTGGNCVYWSPTKPKAFDFFPVTVNLLSEGTFATYQTVWDCRVCHKMVVDTLALEAPLGLASPIPSTPSYDEQVSAALTQPEEPQSTQENT